MRKKTKRKVYQLIDQITFAIEGAALISEKVLNKLRMMELSSIEALTMGNASETDWQNIADMMNIAELMALDGIGPEAMESIIKAQSEMVTCAERYRKIGKLGLTGIGINSIRDAYQYHDLQRQAVSRSKYESYVQKATNMVKSRSRDVAYV